MASQPPITLADAKRDAQELVQFFEWLESQKPAPVEVPAEPVAVVGLQQPTAFYEYIRGDVGELFPTLSQTQLEGIECDLKAGAGVLPLAWMAYCLATDYHETNKTMQGVKEAYWLSEDWRKRHLSYYPWYGRGKVQLTHETNYKKATDRLNELGYKVDLITRPDEALDDEVSAEILVTGCLEGWFTGKKLRDYLPAAPTRENYRNARRIVNGTDKADLIAGYAIEFEKALKLGDWR